MKKKLCGLVRFQCIKKRVNWKLTAIQTAIHIPLISVDVNACVVHAVAQVEVTQVYVNKDNQPIEAIYYFPTNPDEAVTHFQAEFEGRIVKGTVKPHEEAERVYEKAIQNKKTAFLGEETKPDIFKIRVGYLKPGTEVKVIIRYVTEVKNEPGSNAMRFYIPTTIALRYVSPSETDKKAQDIENMNFIEKSPVPLSLKVTVSLQSVIKSIQSPTHKIKVEQTGPIPEKETWHTALVQLSGDTNEMDRDFVLNIVPEEIHKPRLYSEKLEDGSTAMMIHLVPSFKLDDKQSELVFVLDRSGSMSGQSINLATNALSLFLHSMPADCYFNVVGFGSTYELLFPRSVKYDDVSLNAALLHTKCLKADLGGTEILEPLKAIYSQPVIEGYLRQIFILTDGEVSHTDCVLRVIRAQNARVFALGIGDGASHYLVEGIAKAGGGTSAFVTYNESIDAKVLNQLKNATQPSLKDITLDWEGVNIFSSNNKQSPKQNPPVYDGSQLLIFGLFKYDCPSAVTLKCQSPDGPLTIKIEHSSETDVGQTGVLHTLAAIKLVRELELEIAALNGPDPDPHYHFSPFRYGLCGFAQPRREQQLKKEIIELACKTGITSKYTSFVAIDDKDDNQSVSSSHEKNSYQARSRIKKIIKKVLSPFNFFRSPFRTKIATEDWMMETRIVPNQEQYGSTYNNVHGWHGANRSNFPNGQIAQLTPSSCGRYKNGSFSTCEDAICNEIDGRRHTYSLDSENVKNSLMENCVVPERTDEGHQESGRQILIDNAPMCNGIMPQSARAAKNLTTFEDATISRRGIRQSSGLTKKSPKRVSIPLSTSQCEDTYPNGVDLKNCRMSNSIKTLSLLEELISLQSFDGSYQFDDKLSQVLGKPKKALKYVYRLSIATSANGLHDKILATALAIAFFTTKLADQKDLWDLVVDKARKWLIGQTSATQVDEIIAIAQTML